MPSFITPFTGKRGPATYKAARGPVGKSSYGGHAQKKAQGDNLAKKVKKVSNKIMKLRGKRVSGPAATNRY